MNPRVVNKWTIPDISVNVAKNIRYDFSETLNASLSAPDFSRKNIVAVSIARVPIYS